MQVLFLILGAILLVYGVFLIASLGFRFHRLLWFCFAAGFLIPAINHSKIPVWGILLYILIYGGFIAGAVFIDVNNRRTIREGLNREPKVVIILGCKTPSKAFSWRIAKAIALYQRNPDITIVTTGGQGRDELLSEGESARDDLLQLGVPLQSILVENTSANTMENLVNSDRLYYLKDKEVGIVTSDTHVFRSILTARYLGYTYVFVIPAKTDWIYRPDHLLREFLAYIKFRFITDRQN